MFFVFLHVLFYDFWYYVSHIILHNPSVYFIHKIHHRKRYNQLSYADTHEGHLVEHLVQPLGIFVPLFMTNFSVTPLVISFIVIELRGFMRHDERFSWLIGNHHLLHHKYPKHNFGEYWLDKLCGTTYPNNSEYIYGILYT